MFAPTVEDELAVIAQRHNLDEMDVAIIRTYITLPKQAQDALKDFLLRLDIQARGREQNAGCMGG